MSIVLFLPAFLAGGVEVVAVGYDDVVAAVCGGIENGFVFSHEEDCDAGGETAERGSGDFWRGGGWEGADRGEGVMRGAG